MENMESDEPQFLSVTNTNMSLNEDDVKYEEEQDKEMDGMDIQEKEEETGHKAALQISMPAESMWSCEKLPCLPCEEIPIKCHSVRLGTIEIRPNDSLSYVPVHLSRYGLSFIIPADDEYNISGKRTGAAIGPQTVVSILVHFGKCLPVIFLTTTEGFASAMRRGLQITEHPYYCFDPTSYDEREKRITFLIDSITQEHIKYLMHNFVQKEKIKEISQEKASEMLAKSIHGENAQQVSVIVGHPEDTITQILIYPQPPMRGEIEITTKDLACLNEGEYLNDSIIDFYLKYVFYEKLSDYEREKTHIFSSYFYPRLTHKERFPGNSDDDETTIQLKRHSQVKTWTRRVDIFSKDYIIIPVYLNFHWFLAVICFPGQVPDATPNVPAKSDAKLSKSAGNSQTQGRNSTNSSTLYEGKEPLDSEPIPEASDSSTRPDGNHGGQRLKMPCICIFDSLNIPNRWKIAAILRDYLNVEWTSKKGSRKIFDRHTMNEYIMRCPQQTNMHDCGVYLLENFEKFFQIYEVYHFSQFTDALFQSYINLFLKIKQESSGWPADCVSLNERKRYLEAYFVREGVQLDESNIKKNPGRRQVAKLALNSFWGRWGMNLNKILLT